MLIDKEIYFNHQEEFSHLLTFIKGKAMKDNFEKKVKKEDTLGMLIIIIVVLLSMFLMSGCTGLIQGAASDAEEFTGFVRRVLTPSMDKREQNRVDRAARLIIQEKENGK